MQDDSVVLRAGGRDVRKIADADVHDALEALDARLKTLLPAEYGDAYEAVQPTSMGSAALKYDASGQVAWDQIWGSFCDLAMAGGPPHKGTLLEPGTDADINAQFGRYDEVGEEICRGITMVTGLRAYIAPTPGWISVTCHTDSMAAWLVRAIVMENVAARRRGAILELPAAPHFRLEKEIKNVVTVVAKTCHYWVGHIPREQQQAIAGLFDTMTSELPFIEPDLSSPSSTSGREPAAGLASRIHRDTGLTESNRRYPGWLGVECPSVRVAVWMMRALVASNVLSRREGTVLFLPVNPVSDPRGSIVADAVALIYRCASARGVS
jgi:sirohydrochlorin cobaltochelatase